jgi:hypothetical protein
MTNSRARTLGKKELRKIFKEMRFADGLTDTAEDGEFSYWYNKSRDGQIGNYIVYEVVDSNAVYRADDAVIARELYCQIDVFSVRGFETQQLSETLLHLEKKLLEHGFEVEMHKEAYESDTRLYHVVLLVNKLYFYTKN